MVISGGGDGALQDAIRAVVRPDLRTAAEVLEDIIGHTRDAVRKQRSDAEVSALDTDWERAKALIATAEH